MFAAETSFADTLEYLFDLTITEDELIEAADAQRNAVIVRNRIGGISIRPTVFNIVKSLTAGCHYVPVTVDFVCATCDEFNISFTRKEVSGALAGLKRAGKLWRYQAEPGYFLPSPDLADYDRSIH